jgi:hypothetical protein
MRRGEPSFWSDLLTSAAAWVKFPWLPVVSITLTVAADLSDGPWWPVSFLSLFVTAGWIGTERICYLRAFRERGITRDELRRMTLSFIPRFAILGMAVAPLIIPAVIVFAATAPTDGATDVAGFLLYANAVGFVLGVTCTFIMPALAFTTRRVRTAVRIGLRMIRTEWPTCWAYVLLPPLIGLAIVRSVGPWAEADLIPRLFALTGAPLLNLWFKGATAAFSLRRWETGDDGAAFIPRAAHVPGPEPSDDARG